MQGTGSFRPLLVYSGLYAHAHRHGGFKQPQYQHSHTQDRFQQ